MKKEEKREEAKPVPWEAADPPLPVVQSGHMESRREYQKSVDKTSHFGV